jgi:hypothetical protein
MERKSGGQINIGASSLVLILIVLVLTTMGVLSLSNAKNDLDLAEKNAASVKNYYEAGNAAEHLLQKTDQTLTEAFREGSDREKIADQLSAAMGNIYDRKKNVFSADIEMDNGRALSVTAAIDWNPDIRYTLQGYHVYIREHYEIDKSRPVWTGTGE